jgi:cytoskeleton protein RodZ
MVEGQVEPQEARRIGAMLQQRRVQSGYEVADISQFLCIRQPHLRAIEAGRFEDLPGPAYATGFVRTYAEFLGLDAADIGRRVRAEMLPAQPEAPLSLPQSEVETTTPGAGILLVGAMIALAAYGGWYLTSDHRRDPARFAPAMREQPATPHVSGKQFAAAEPAMSAAATSESAKPAPGGTDKPSQALKAAAPSQATFPFHPPAAPADQETRPAVPTTAVRAAATAPSLPSPDTVADTEAQSPPPVQISPTTTTAMAAEPPAAETVSPARPPASAVPGARIVLKAKADSWVEVRDPQSNSLLVARLLRAGDAYDVPDKPGLKLVTGNAGGLVVVVDGEAIPPLGKDGAVRRNITLDPDVLRRVAEAGASR